MEPRCFCVVADFYLRIVQPAKLFDGFNIRRTHIRRGNNTELAAVLRKFPQFVHDEPQAAPLDKGYQHVNSVGRDNFFFELREHLRFMHRTGKERALCDGCFRALYVRRSFSHGKPRIGFSQKRKKLLGTFVNTECGKVGFLRCTLN